MKLHLRDLPKQIALSFSARTSLLVLSQPGIGKTDTINAAAETMKKRVEGFELIHIDVPSMSPTDIGATMPNRETGLLEFFCNAMLPNFYVTPDWTGIINFGEILNTDPTTLKLMQKYDNGEDINGRLRKPKGAVIIADSNRIIDKSGVMQQSRAFMNRFEQIEVYTDPKGNIEYAEKMDFHPKIQDFFKNWPDLIDNYDRVFIDQPTGKSGKEKDDMLIAAEEGKRGLWACMRGWKRVSDLEYACDQWKEDLIPQRAIGNVGTAIGLQYMAHRSMFGKIAGVDEIVRDPKAVAVPDKLDELYAQLVLLAMLVDIKNMKQVDIYLKRVPQDLKAMCINRMLTRSRKHKDTFNLSPTKEFQSWVSDPAFSDLLMARS
jgi:hypothetical protein